MDDSAFEALSDEYRRDLLSALLSRDDVHPLSPHAVAMRETEADRARARLHHNHLPKLDEEGYIDWNRETDTVTAGPAFDEIRPLLLFLEEWQDVAASD